MRDELVPFYVTRKNAEDQVATWRIGTRNGLTIILLGQLALLAWLVIALVSAVTIIAATLYDLGADVVSLF